jgi:DNA mismatch endonuclease (patch repair protein)
MRAIRRRDTKPERRVRSLLHRSGLRFRVDYPIPDGLPRPVRPDIVFIRPRLAIFIDGCFWHGCPIHGSRQTARNATYWTRKIARNKERDAEQVQRLEKAGWRALRFWEHEEPAQIAAAIRAALDGTWQREDGLRRR